ncbi:hypothetical protein LWI28_024558 [Acer negundo]|uniref:Uncharacterized protein n=1 Tax=Acer negundo TaxID=4023 RepID=A0AAD5NYC9_ACENE|nr:hypothetical protein LWI28_024558 [Acer negundo]
MARGGATSLLPPHSVDLSQSLMRDCSLPKKAMITSSQITEPSMEVAIEMSSGKMRWTATELMEMSSVELIEEEDGFLVNLMKDKG